MAKCVITYNGKDYTYPEFAAELSNGLLADLVSRGVINASTLTEAPPKSTRNTDIEKVKALIKKAFPKVEIRETDESIAGKLENGVIYLNPNYVGLDTPIHEAAHVLIDSIGYDNSVIKKAISQLRDTYLYKQTKERYPELDELTLDKEVLAEAIGLEGEGIFKGEDKSTFGKYLDYIFDWIKTKLGFNKNVAKTLAKQVLYGIGTKKMVSKEEGAQLQKTKEGSKSKERKERIMKVMPLSLYRTNIKLRDLNQEQKDLQQIQELLSDENLTKEDRARLVKVKEKIESIKEKDLESYDKYRKDVYRIIKISETEDLATYGVDELSEIYNKIKFLDPTASNPLMDSIQKKIAYILWNEQNEVLKGKEGYIENVAKRKDISGLDVKMKSLSHFTENNPEMQSFSKIADKAFLDEAKERNDKQFENDKLARAVIAEKNKQLGLGAKALNYFSSDTAKYFEYMDDGNGNLLTIEQAKQKKLSEAQINYLKFVRNLIAERSKVEVDPETEEMGVLKVDKKFQEAYKTSGIVDAFSYYLGGGRTNLSNVRIDYNGKAMSFGDIESDIIKKAEQGTINKLKALGDIAYYNYHARKQLKKGYNIDESVNPMDVKQDSQYHINPNGVLTSKFDRPRDKNRGYSKDFYRAVNEYIADTAHVKHMSKILPVVNSLEYLAKNGLEEADIARKPETAKWIDEWRKMKVFKQSNVNAPEVDIMLSFLRKLTSMSTMMFNFTAQGLNALMGTYNNFRSENLTTLGKGYKRLYSGARKDINKDYAYGLMNPMALDFARKYSVASIDIKDEIKPYIGNIFAELGHLGTKWGEANTQITLALGLMEKDLTEYFEYKKDKFGIDQLVVKEGVDEKKLEDQINYIKNRVSDIQGKYSEKDRRNIENNELGRAAFQFKTWIPDWWKERFGAKYIDRNGVVRRGSWNVILTREGIKDLKRVVNEKGWKKGLFDGKTNESKAFLANLKGALVVGALLSLKYGDDDDDKKKKSISALDNVYGQMMFIFDADQLKYTIKNPFAIVGTTTRFIDALQQVLSFEEEEYQKAAKNAYKLIPGRKLGEAIYDLASEDE